MSVQYITVEGACQNNLKNISLHIPLNALTVVTGVSGSGKSSLAFDTIYSEGQRRYFETFSAYTRQFLDRMDKPKVDKIEGIPPAIAIDQINPVRTSRSTVGTMTELNDHMKLLFAKAALLFCGKCGKQVKRDTPDSILEELLSQTDEAVEQRIIIAFTIAVPHNFSVEEMKELLAGQGYLRFLREDDESIEVIQDRTVLEEKRHARIAEDLEASLKHGAGKATVYFIDKNRETTKTLKFSSDLHCPDCNIHYRDPIPNMFSFNSPIGACETCRGFGRTIGIDYDLVIPDRTKSLAEGAVRPWQSKSYAVCQEELMHFARKQGIRTHISWSDLSEEEKQWVIEGEGDWDDGVWYGIERFFRWLESRSYKMHIRVLLSNYRTYHTCPSCGGARLKPEPLLWRLTDENAEFRPNMWEIMQLPISESTRFFSELRLPSPIDEAAEIVLSEIRSRLAYLEEVGLGYITLDRQSRTLSGGEVQRINLTTALGTSLVNTLFVLDEPSIGLHSRDIQRLISILHRLRDGGNTLLVVEHDPEVIRAADYVLDLGPDAGEKGGEVLFFDTPDRLIGNKRSVTGRYLTGNEHRRAAPTPAFSDNLPALPAGDVSADAVQTANVITILGAAEHNLKSIDVSIPLNRLVCVSGVSGSGKSTLLHDICYNGIRMIQHKPVDQPGRHDEIRGAGLIDEVVMVDQTPIGKTTRSNPASYVGAFDAIRTLFSREPLAKQRNYTAGMFSFNSPKGRCPTCGGNGFEHVEMQFLSDVYIRCPDCGGKRYRNDVLEVTLLSTNGEAKTIAEVLESTVDDACLFFDDQPEVLRKLQPLRDVGLGYIRLGQPVPSLSGGEAQRLKLAGHLAATAGKTKIRPTLFLFDEPTTGLHFRDIAVLLRALRRLMKSGHSVVVIEHNLDVLLSADWIIDLGPEGGHRGGEIVFEGPPSRISGCKRSHTGKALQSYLLTLQSGEQPVKENAPRYQHADNNHITIRGAREHNLKDIDIVIPRDTFTVITGVSGSGKSTVAFDILFSEGQRRYLESLNAYARQFVQPVSRPAVDGVAGVPPTVAIEQRTSRGGWKSTVATVTEIYHFIRLLFVRLGTQYCPDCDIAIQPQTREEIIASLLADFRGKAIEITAPLVLSRKGYYTDLAQWALRKGFRHLRVDGEYLSTETWPRLDRYKEHTIQAVMGTTTVTPENRDFLRELLERGLRLGNNRVHIISQEEADREPIVFSTERSCPQCGKSFEEPDPRLFSYNSKHGWCSTCMGTGLKKSSEENHDGQSSDTVHPSTLEEEPCPACNGARLNGEALAVRFQDHSIAYFNRYTVLEAEQFFAGYKPRGREAEIARDVVSEVRSRLSFLIRVGLSYLTLDRAAPTLSGGEAQRIRLASQLGSNLRGVCYILDEPTIGLHAKDNRMLMKTLKELKTKGNSVVVVEHDEETIKTADHIIDLGPGGGIHGGNVVFSGPLPELLDRTDSATANLLRNPLGHPMLKKEKQPEREAHITVHNASAHNLRNIDVTFPVGRLICITGVSGSGKSTLARDVLYTNLYGLLRTVKRRKSVGSGTDAASSIKRKSNSARLDQTDAGTFLGCERITGWEPIGRTLEVDQTPIGKTTRSCPATYIGFWDDIRKLFAGLPEARMRGYTPSRFSFNVKGGRCEVCAGQGVKKIEMSFLPDVTVPCEACGGKRFNRETLDITYRGKTIADVLEMSIEEAESFFRAHPSIHRALSLLNDIGLSYLTLGQQSPTLSGGEAQRIKLVTELTKSNYTHTLYVLDEPTVGLHMADIEKLLKVLHRLVLADNTIVIIEHNLDVIAEADWIIDLGPDGGKEGGRIAAEGPPSELIKTKNGSHTAKFLRSFLKKRRN